MEFGEFLKAVRKERKRSQRDVAAAVDIDFTYLSKIERGKLPPPGADTLDKLAKTLAIPLSIIFERAGKCFHCKGSGKAERTKS